MPKVEQKPPDVDAIIAAAGAKTAIKPKPSPVFQNTPMSVESETVLTGPISFGLSPTPVVPKTVMPILPGVSLLPSPNNDVKYGKAYQIAVKTSQKLKVKSLASFVELVEEISKNL